MDEEVSAIEWCPDTVDTRIYAVFYYSLEGKKENGKAKASALELFWAALATVGADTLGTRQACNFP